MHFRQVPRAADALCWICWRSNEKVLTNLIYFLKNILVCVTHWNRCFSFVSPSVFSRSLLFSLPLLSLKKTNLLCKIYLFAYRRCLSRRHRKSWIEFHFFNTIRQVEVSWAFKLMTSFIFIKMLSLQALHPSFVNPPFDLYLIFSFHISLDSFSVPQKVYDKLTVVVLICLPMSLYVLHRLSSHVIKRS